MTDVTTTSITTIADSDMAIQLRELPLPQDLADGLDRFLASVFCKPDPDNTARVTYFDMCRAAMIDPFPDNILCEVLHRFNFHPSKSTGQLEWKQLLTDALLSHFKPVKDCVYSMSAKFSVYTPERDNTDITHLFTDTAMADSTVKNMQIPSFLKNMCHHITAALLYTIKNLESHIDWTGTEPTFSLTLTSYYPLSASQLASHYATVRTIINTYVYPAFNRGTDPILTRAAPNDMDVKIGLKADMTQAFIQMS